MSHLDRLILLASMLVLTPSVGAQVSKVTAAVRVALLGGDKSEPIRNLLTLAEGKLGQAPGIALVERQAIARVLAEQKLNLSGLVAADQAVAVGKLFGADLFAFIEPDAAGKEVAGLVVFDARTGVRLWDAALPSGDLDKAISAMTEALVAARRKRSAVEKLRPVCLVAVRNADLPRGLDAFCDAVSLLVERALVASPDLAVLERRRLDQVNKERDLPTDSPLRQLKASVVTADLEISSLPGGKGLRATVQLSDGSGRSIGKASAEVPLREAERLAQALAKDLVRALNARVAPKENGRVEEAWRFRNEFEFFVNHGDSVRALRAAESACALQPDDAFFRLVLAQGLMQQSGTLLHAHQRSRIDDATFEQALALALRASDIIVDVAAAPADPKRARQVAWIFAKAKAEAGLSGALWNISKVRDKLSEAEQSAITRIRSNAWRCDQIRLEQLRKAVVDKNTFDQYTDHASRVILANKEDRFLPPAMWADLVCSLRPWAETARQFEDDRAAWTEPLLSRLIEAYGPPRPHTAEDVGRLRQFWTQLQGHPNTIIAAYGRLGGLVNDLSYGNVAEADARRRVRDYRLHLEDILAKKDGLSPSARIALYVVARHAFLSNDRLRMPGRFEEAREFCESMLRRNEVFVPLIRLNAEFHATVGTRGEYDPVYAYDFLQRAVAVLDSKDARFLSEHAAPALAREEQARFRTAAQQMQSMMRAFNPGLAGKMASAWEKTLPLIDVSGARRGITWLQQPVVHGESVYLAAVGREGPDKRHDVQLVRVGLTGDSRQEGRPIKVDLRSGADPILNASGQLRFGSIACIEGDHYCLGTHAHGIYVFPLNGAAPWQISTADGLPSDVVRALTCLDGRVYAFLGRLNQECYLVSCDLRTRRCDVLVSSRRKEKRSLFDDREPTHFAFLAADLARHRILTAAFAPHWPSPLTGLWTIDPKTGKFDLVLPLHFMDQGFCSAGSRVEGDQLLLSGRCGVCSYDLARKDNRRLVFDGKVSLEVNGGKSALLQVEALPQYRLVSNEFNNVQDPAMTAAGWVYAAHPFCRRRFDNGKVEHLTTLDPKRPGFYPSQCLLPLSGKGEVLIGDSFGLWLVTPRAAVSGIGQAEKAEPAWAAPVNWNEPVDLVMGNAIGGRVAVFVDDTSVISHSGPYLKRRRLPDGMAVRSYRGHKDAIRAVAVSADREQLASSDEGKNVLIWDLASGQLVKTIAAREVIRSLAFSPDGNRLVGGGSPTVFLWDLPGGNEASSYTGMREGDFIHQVAFTPDGSQVASSGQTFRVWNIQSGATSLENGPLGGPMRFAMSRDGGHYYLASSYRMLWRKTAAKVQPLQDVGANLFDVSFAPGQQRLVVSGQGFVGLAEPQTGKLIARLPIPGNQSWYSILSPNGRFLAVVNRMRDDSFLVEINQALAAPERK